MDEKLKFGIISLIVIIFQSALKIYGVIITGSLSFLSESVDTIVDIVFVSITLYSIKHSQKPPDYDHMWGHSKTDPIGALIQGIILINLYIILVFYALLVITSGEYQIAYPDIGLQILIISFLINLIFSRILIWQGRRNKSPSLEMQGLNLFQDSMRAVIVIISFIFALMGTVFLDPFFSIVLSVWIIIGAVILTKKGVKDLTDINPIDSLILEDIRQNIFKLEHVIGVKDLRIRASGKNLFLETNISVEDHISVIHAHEITKSIRAMSQVFFPNYNVECLVEMNPLGGEESLGENIINLIYSMKTEFPDILNVKNLNVFRIGDKYFLSLIIVISDEFSLKEAHEICTNFEIELKKQAPFLSRIITHIESQFKENLSSQEYCDISTLDSDSINEIKRNVEEVLRSEPYIRGYHGFEFWTTYNYCILELHIFFDGDENISQVHNYLTDIEKKIRNKLKIDNLKEIFLHSEPLKGRTGGIIFESEK
ncbi:MAG: cation transporter [Promethearchaeota archaeon]|nr:MAG: cation transporter [Candidatus Lokiarchaeota archaeon]